jgi:hypothetical protein
MDIKQLLENAEQLTFDINANITEQPQQEQLSDLLQEVTDILYRLSK